MGAVSLTLALASPQLPEKPWKCVENFLEGIALGWRRKPPWIRRDGT